MSQSKILCVSDVAIGYGSPQIQHFLNSLSETLDGAEVLLIHPDQKRRESKSALYENFQTKKIVTRMPPYDEAFAIEYNRVASRIIQEWEPNVVVATHGWALPSVLENAEQGFQFIYYMLEDLSHQVSGMGAWAETLNRHAFELANTIVTSESRRLKEDVRLLRLEPSRYVEILNVGHQRNDKSVATSERKNCILAAGSIGPQACSEFMLLDSVSHIQFEIAGPAETDQARQFLDSASDRNNLSYLGLMDAENVFFHRQNRAYSLVVWNPDNINRLFASPNKMFESIAAGTPVIAAPHPQCLDIVDRYDCGIMMRDWTEKAFSDAVCEATELFENDSDRYQELCDNCISAAKTDLNWDAQFKQFSASWP